MSCAFYLSATNKSSGKTFVSLGLCAALSKDNYQVQSFKKGLDYIDPIWLSLASNNPCINLDFWTMDKQEILEKYHSYNKNADISIVEGNKGLYDGLSVKGGDSNADMAKLLKLAIVLVVDSSGITRGIAPLLQGYINFDNSNIVGVILNKIATNRHQTKLINAIEYYTDLTIFGAIKRNSPTIEQRHLGLKPANENSTNISNKIILDAANSIKEQVDIKHILAKTKVVNNYIANRKKLVKFSTNISIAIAKDEAFGFYYNDDLEKFNQLGVNIKYFNAITDKKLPKTDALFLGGGFPEIYAQELAKNSSLLLDIRTKIKQGMPTYAECGGLMYLSNNIIIGNNSFAMVGAIDADTIMCNKPIGRGYVQLEANNNHIWHTNNKSIYAHEFHYSKLININANTKYAYKVLRGYGIDGQNDGIIVNNLLACYTHMRNTNANNWVKNFIDFINLNI